MLIIGSDRNREAFSLTITLFVYKFVRLARLFCIYFINENIGIAVETILDYYFLSI